MRRILTSLVICGCAALYPPRAIADDPAAYPYVAGQTLLAEVRRTVDERTQFFTEIAARLQAGERAATMQHSLTALANDPHLNLLFPRVSIADLPATHRPIMEDGQVVRLPATLDTAMRDVEDALAPGPYRLREFYWRGMLRVRRYETGAGVRDLLHYAERMSIVDPDAQEALMIVAVIYTSDYQPDPRGLAILHRLAYDERVGVVRASAVLRLAMINWRHSEYAESATHFTAFTRIEPDSLLRTKAQLLAGQSHIKAKQYQHAIDVLQDLVDLDIAEFDRDVRAEALYWLADSHRNTGQREGAIMTAFILIADYPRTKWAKMARAAFMPLRRPPPEGDE